MVRCIILLITIVWGYGKALSQPANDDCNAPIEVAYAPNEASANFTAGDTRGATPSVTPVSVCSGTFYYDDVWFAFTTPDTLPSAGITVKAYFDTAQVHSDVIAIGMAVYSGCDAAAIPMRCFSSEDPDDTSVELSIQCLQLNQVRPCRLTR